MSDFSELMNEWMDGLMQLIDRVGRGGVATRALACAPRNNRLSRKTNVLTKNQRVWALYPISNALATGATDEIPEGSKW
jgi:hypothetical protein